MAKEDGNESCCAPADSEMSCCKVESVVSVDDRGQMVLPKEVRERAEIHSGDKLAVVSWEKGGKICCVCLIKADELTGMVRNILGPLMKDVTK